MNILVTGAAGFVGRNLVENLKCIRDGKNHTRPQLSVEEIYEYDLGNTPEELDRFCSHCDFVFNLAGVNRPKDPREFAEGNFGFASTLLDTLKKHDNKCPVMLSSSLQATLAGRFGASEYGLSKRDGEELFFRYAQETGATVYVYRFPNLVGKWVRPNYNSAVGTFCHNIANDLPITVNDPKVELELLYVDDLIDEMLLALEGREHHCEFDGVNTVLTDSGRYCAAPVTHHVTLGEIVALLDSFKAQPQTLVIPEIPEGSFAKKLYSTYLSYLPREKAERLFSALMEHTAPGGLHAMNQFVRKSWLGFPPDAEEAERKAEPWYTGELARFYRDWNILSMEEDTFPCESGGIPHVHCMDIVIAEKAQRALEE